MSLLRMLCVIGLLLGSTLWAGVGKVALLKGEAVAERNAQIITLQTGTAIEEKDAIKTSKDAQVQLLFEDKTVITLGSESEFKIEEYLNDATNPKAKFKFNQGSFKTITGQIGKTAPQNFTMETKTATIGIRGTIVKGSTGDQGDMIACLRGNIVVTSRDTGKTVEIPAGQFTTVKPNEAPATPKETQASPTDENLVKNTTDNVSPTVISSVEEAKNNVETIAKVTQNSSFPSGTIALYGLATSNDTDLELAFTLDRATAKSTGTLGSYSLDSPVNGVVFRGTYSETYEGMSSTWFFVANYDPETFIELDEYGEPYATNFTGYEKFTHKHGDTVQSGEAFWREGFISDSAGPKGYFGSYDDWYGNIDSEYVSWGVWGTLPEYDEYYDYNTWLADQHYWVGGSERTPESVIQSLMTNSTTYTYTGNVLGKTYDGNSWGQIDTANSNVNLIFNFGSTSTINANSTISFSSWNGDSWVLKPTGSTVSTTGFTSSIANGVNGGTINVLSGTINGQFFGSGAQAIGGTFNAIGQDTNIKQAVGVFKAVQP